MSDQTKEPKNITDSEESLPSQNIFILETGNESKSRTIGLFGNLNEEQLIEVVQALAKFTEDRSEEKQKEKQEDIEIIVKPIRFYISTWGGDIAGMFGIYDLMRDVQKEYDIETFGLGKVMSAGILLLAAGTKGKRKIGKNTRLMLHGIQAGHVGTLHTLENEIEETRWLQDRMIESLIIETKLTKRKIKTILDKKVDVYFDAEEAIKVGIADIIV